MAGFMDNMQYVMHDIKEEGKQMEKDVPNETDDGISEKEKNGVLGSSDKGKGGNEELLENGKEEISGMAEGAMDLINGLKDDGLMGFLEEALDGDGAQKENEADESSESGPRAPDDSYSIGSFFSDIQSFGSNAEELLEESKKFFTKLGAVVAMAGTCISSGKDLAAAIKDEDLKHIVISAVMLIGIQVPVTLGMLVIFLKEWVKATVKGCIAAKEGLEDLASDFDSLIDDTEMEDENGEQSASKPKSLEADSLKRDLEKTKKKNNYGSTEDLDKPTTCVIAKKKTGIKANGKSDPASKAKGVPKKRTPHNQKDDKIHLMEEGKTAHKSRPSPSKSTTRRRPVSSRDHVSGTRSHHPSTRHNRDGRISNSRTTSRPSKDNRKSASHHSTPASQAHKDRSREHKPKSLEKSKGNASHTVESDRPNKSSTPKSDKGVEEEKIGHKDLKGQNIEKGNIEQDTNRDLISEGERSVTQRDDRETKKQ